MVARRFRLRNWTDNCPVASGNCGTPPPRAGWFHDFLGSWSEAEMQLWLRYYACDAERAEHAREYPDDIIPP
jgi:hypothetical protein